MKKLFLFATLCIIAFTTKAKELSFEEPVKYIQNKYAEFNQDKPNSSLHSFKAEKNGILDIETSGSPSHFNFLNLGANRKIDVDRFGMFIDTTQDRSLAIKFYSDNNFVSAMYFKTSLTVAGLEKIYKALFHLRSLCTKEKDPFDN